MPDPLFKLLLLTAGTASVIAAFFAFRRLIVNPWLPPKPTPPQPKNPNDPHP